MLSIGKCSAAMAANYYEQEKGYYTQTQSDGDEWQGDLCKKLGLEPESEINPAQFEAMLQGSQVAAFDLTFSADKSVSIAAQMSPELERDMLAAHRKAVSNTLKTVERDIGTRVRGIDGNPEQTFVQTSNAAIAKVEHQTSRLLDPDLHTHCVVLNKTAYNGKIYSLDGHKLYENKMRYGLEYRQHLATELQKQGYELELTDGEKGFFEIKGIRPDVRQHFSKRRGEIEQRLSERGESGAEASDRATQETRSAKEKGVNLEDLKSKWQQQLSEMQQQAPEKSVALGRDIEKEQRAALNRAVTRLSEKQFAFEPQQLQCAVMSEGVCCGINSNTADRLIATNPKLLKLKPTQESGLKGKYYTTVQNMQMAAEIETMAAEGRGKAPAVSAEKCAKSLNEVCAKNGWELGEQQSAVVDHIATTPDRFVAVRGLAGTGKTFTLNATREVLEAQGYEVRGMSATGQAADELAADAKISDCGTIHHQLNKLEREAGNAQPRQDYSQKTSWNFEGLKPSPKPTVWFCDEASLTDNKLFYHIQKMAATRGDKVVFVGDDRQMLPVGQGNAFAELVQRGEIATCELSNIVRQKDPELLQAVREAVRGQTKASLDIISDDIREIKTRGHRLNAVAKEYCSLSPAEQRETLVLTARNTDRIAINNKIRERLIKAGQLSQGNQFEIQADEKKPVEQRYFAQKDKIVFLRNDKKLGVMNGTKGVIERIDGNIITANIGKDKTVSVDLSQYKAVDHGYCVTPHKGQGATVDRAIVHMNSADKALNSKNSYYVDISRARKSVKLFVDSRSKLDPQISKFAKKITAKDFKPAAPSQAPAPVRFLGCSKTAGNAAKSVVNGAGKAAEAVLSPLSFIPVVGKLLSAVGKAAVKGAVTVAKKGVDATVGVVKQGIKTAANSGGEVQTRGKHRSRQ